MEIRIDKNWVITSDTLQFILNQRKIVKTGKYVGREWFCSIGYYPTIPQLVSGLIHQGIRDSDVTNFAELAAEVERIGLLCQEAFDSGVAK
ncbi:hypothetical protein BFS14_22720 [Serratia fonticola]|uniref:DUF5405 family protein n=1 Tax=Serratia fonticola TaxID=47917 RepID=UPI0008FD3CB3|nr:DUF5405 family protein [Serratia fonticola]OIX91516.1 hypothetical protein BFS14_22720 [Serratia fonticola]QCR63215.1 hypothetical protein FD644_23985 [Serratia fonticola]